MDKYSENGEYEYFALCESADQFICEMKQGKRF